MEATREVLGTAWERRSRRTALVFAIGAGVVTALLGAALRGHPAVVAPVALAAGLAVQRGMTRRVRRRRRILGEPFPAQWEEILQREVVFYRFLVPEERERFRRELQVFLGETRITGVKTEVDTTTRVLAGASAIIPVFGFPEWEWDQISEVLIYPARFDEQFAFGDGAGQRTLGLVGTGFMNRLMILSKPDLLRGFRQPGDRRNVGLHEFAHLVDKSDGAIDGVPEIGMDAGEVAEWRELVRRKMEEIREGRSDIDPYGLTNEAEFFAVATEYFFERPGVLRARHPELYRMLARAFRQDLGSRVTDWVSELRRKRPRFGRNSPCPCGSGAKYKKCCLGRKGPSA